jgi:tetratricopeptide (TPR) repeat protein
MKQLNSILMVLTMAVGLNLVTPNIVCAATQREVDEALNYLKSQSNSAQAHFDLAMLYAKSPNLMEAWDLLKKIPNLDPTFADKMKAQLEPKLLEDPTNENYRFQLAFVYYFQGKKDLSMAQFEELVRLNKQDPWPLNYLAYLKSENNQYAECEKLIDRAAELDKDNAVTYFLRGQLEYQKGNYLGSAKAIATAIRLKREFRFK